MAFDLSSISRNEGNTPPIMVLHGTPGIGKTTFAAQLPKPLFIMTDKGGLGVNKVDAFPHCQRFDDVMTALKACYELPVGQKETLVIDSLSSLEPLLWDKVALEHGKANIEDIGYAKGYTYAMTHWRSLYAGFRGLLDRGIFKMVVLIAHSNVIRFENPETESYDVHTMKVHKLVVNFCNEQSDIIAFANQPIRIRKVDEDKKARSVANEKGGKILYLAKTPSVAAKNRYALPDSIDFDATTFLNTLKGDK